MIKGRAIVIMGDINARIANWQINEEGEREKLRNSDDRTLNREGEKLLEWCEEVGGVIKNGATEGDWKGKATFIGEGYMSVLDLVIEIESGKEDVVRELKVETRIESDHLPIEVSIEVGAEGVREKVGKKKRKEKGKVEK